MPELPEIAILARQMRTELVGRTITGITVLQPRCLNISRRAFVKALVGARIEEVLPRGKWLMMETTQGWLLLSLGMGGEILLVTPETLPRRRRLVIDFAAGQCLAINFWWFGYAHYVRADKLQRHAMTAKLGPNALDLTAGEWQTLIGGKRGQLKSFLLDQSKIAGIGNAYVHDILFLARLHPLRKIQSLSPTEKAELYKSVRVGLQTSLAKGGSSYEVNLYGQKGGFTLADILIGYKKGKPCPACGTLIEKIKTGSTSSFICPRCQPFKV